MSFLSILAALFLEQLRPLPHPSVFELWFVRYANRLSRDLNAGQPVHGTVGWLLGVLPWVAAALIAHYVLDLLNPLLAWAWDVAVLYACINFKRALQVSYGDPTIFVTRPISLVLLIIGAVMLALMVLPSIRRSREVAFQE